jgi:hypothetical protein
MRDQNWVRVVAFAAGVAIFLLLLGPTLCTRWIGELPGRAILGGVAPAGKLA